MKAKRVLWKMLPCGLSAVFGLAFMALGIEIGGNAKALFVSIAAAFFALPLMYLFYQQAVNLSEKRLNKEIFEYAKMGVDTDIASLLHQLEKTIHTMSQRDSSPAGMAKLLTLEAGDIKTVISTNVYMGFQVLKNWDVSEGHLHDAMQSSPIHRSLSTEQVISVISVIRRLGSPEAVQRTRDLYVPTGEQATGYKVVSGREASDANTEFPNRYLLMKSLGDDKFLVSDFGDFAALNRDHALQYFRVSGRMIDLYATALANMLEAIRDWLDLTGSEFLLDEKMFRLAGVRTGSTDGAMEARRT